MQLTSVTVCACSCGLRQEEGPQQQPDIIGSLLFVNEGRTCSPAYNMHRYSFQSAVALAAGRIVYAATQRVRIETSSSTKHVLCRGWIGARPAEQQHTAAVLGSASKLDSLTAACVRPASAVSFRSVQCVNDQLCCFHRRTTLKDVTAMPPTECQSGKLHLPCAVAPHSAAGR